MSLLYAICRVNGNMSVKKISMDSTTQQRVQALFDQQHREFMNGINTVVPFNGDWNPDGDELLSVANTAEMNLVRTQVLGNPTALQDIDARYFTTSGIKALCMRTSMAGNNTEILVQPFSAAQMLNNKFALYFNSGTFTEFSNTAFTISSHLDGIIRLSDTAFKSFSNLKKIFDLSHTYTIASDADITDIFSGRHNISGDLASILASSDQTMRKLFHSVKRSGVLTSNNVNDIATKAQSLGINLQVNNGMIVMPAEKRDQKIFLRFLEDGVYEAKISGLVYQTNSKIRI
ncbi:MAG: Kiwa anti-phage protein KwaB-like domain-containing protein [Niveispirillum sp.]|uniref:Kiwa anti-phage protein KwaB-like domain-containing protein n=1 Tax=Niveispirillum sp. TaxID=1917217 RepID=UPI003BA80780